jgi:hypothetical protein
MPANSKSASAHEESRRSRTNAPTSLLAVMRNQQAMLLHVVPVGRTAPRIGMVTKMVTIAKN